MFCAIREVDKNKRGPVDIVFTSEEPVNVEGVLVVPFVSEKYDPDKGLLGSPIFMYDGSTVTEVLTYIDINYCQKRKKEYPSIGDQLDALWKGGDALAEMQARIMAVKEKYPKE
jgi:hypothetical protein